MAHPAAHAFDVEGHDYEGDELITGEAVALDLRPASFVLRAAGAMIDFAATVLVMIALIYLLTSPDVGLVIDGAALQAISIVFLVVFTIAVPAGVETLTRGKSLGKLAVGARIVRDDGGAIGFRHAFIRSLTGFLEIFATLGGLAALVALLNSRSKRLGDLLAGTYSQNERVGAIVDPVFIVPSGLTEWARTADVARMPDPLSRRIAAFLVQAGGLVPDARARLASELANEAARYVNAVPAAHPEAFLLAITAIRRDREYNALQLAGQRMQQLEPVLGGLPHRFPDRS
ncbi:MAG: hypothetical protein JWL94_1493 [Microbacteriaceae bacterium]|jgi:uncharacterized RDD family membrane protein YckC|nr:hypothetical protein [Microbacteriaceae bacterium]